MATFLQNLWTSIFTPGTNSSLVTATHISFCALQLTFLALLIGTRSIHFVILSFICAGLWMGITWFIGELEILKREQEEFRDRMRRGEKEIGRGGGKEKGGE